MTMTPTLQETLVSEQTVPRPVMRPPVGDEVVISGMSGIFPSSNSVEEFMENLYNKVDMVKADNTRWEFSHPEVPQHLGIVNGMNKFDAQFFRVHYKQACSMDPMSRKLMEHAYSAIYDSGTNPLYLRGKKVGVFIGCAVSDYENTNILNNIQQNGFGITGCNKSMYANRISYWIDGKGPSYTLDIACASSMGSLEHAYRAISTGQCEAAIVGGCNLCVHPNASLNYRRFGLICLDGKTRCFDKNSDGYVRSDTMSILFLQKAKDAKRIYSEVYYAKSNYSIKNKQFLAIKDPKQLEDFFEAFYSEIDVSPEQVEYIEANGAALPEADTKELKAIGKIFAKNKPVKIGCVKSNMGSSESASGICGITKVCLAYKNGKLAGNLHYKDPLDVPEVKDGKLQVITDNVDFKRGFAALNSFSFSGVNVHVLLKGHYKQKELDRYNASIPRLVVVSGRQDNCVDKIMNTLKQRPIDPEQIGLLHNIHKYEIPGHMSRGYIILDTNEKNETVCLGQNTEYYPGNTRPVWFVYSGIGSQWATMGAELMRIPIFSAAIQKCHKVLEPRGIDIVRILTDPDKTVYDNILHSFVGIAAVQIGLTDILKAIGIVPDNIIGHSVGELGCAYADGCFTAEEMILAAYCRGLVSVQTPFIRGSMAAVGLGYSDVLPLCPPEVEVACHNSPDSATISGPADTMKQFVTELTSKGIFAKEVPCSNIAFHSRYIAEAGPGLLKYLSEVIKDPKARSEKWVSTSVPQDKWDQILAKHSSAEYHTNNLLNSVLFEETSKLIPADALVIEIAPHGLLQAILKKSMPDCVHIPLTKREVSDPVKYFLEAIGKLYQNGLNPEIDALYPTIQYPVSTGTPFLSQLVEWEHSEDWPEAICNTKKVVIAPLRQFVMSIHDDEYRYFKGHARDGNCILPESALLVLAWETFAMYKGVNYRDLSVVFENVQFNGEIILKPEQPVSLQIMMFKGNHKFEISYNECQVIVGYLNEIETNASKRGERNLQLESTVHNVLLDAKDIYTMLSLKGYGYRDEFQSIVSSTSSKNSANIKWTDNWISFLDSLIQLNVFARDFDGLSSLSIIQKLEIDVETHKNAKHTLVDKVTCMNADIYMLNDHTRCGGVEIDGLIFKDIHSVEHTPDVLLTQNFLPHFLTEIVKIRTAVEVNLQMVSENVINDTIYVSDFVNEKTTELSKTIKEVVSQNVSHKFIIESDKIGQNLHPETNLVVVDNLLGDKKRMNAIYKALPYNTFIIALELDTTKIHPQYKLFSIISAMSLQKQTLILLRKVNTNADENVTYMPIVHEKRFEWVSRLTSELERSRKVILISERQPYCGLIGMVKKLRKLYGDKIRLIVVDDYHVPSFNAAKDIFKDQLEKNLAINVLCKGQWGGYYNISNNTDIQLDNIRITSTIAGDLEGLSWIESPPLAAENNLVQVCYAGISRKDVILATSEVTNDDKPLYGMEFSGINERGDKVMGLVASGALASKVEADPDFLWPVPEHWTLEDAATVPLAFAYAYFCLSVKANIKRGAKVIVNGGACAYGQAVISVCLSVNCEVFVTVTDNKQKEFLLKIFPGLKAKNIGHDPQLLIIPGMGNDANNNIAASYTPYVIVNFLSGPMRKAAMKHACQNLLYLDLNDYDMKNNEVFGMAFLGSISNYVSVNINSLFQKKYAHEKKHIQLYIAQGISNGTVRPLKRVVYPPSSITQACRLVSANTIRGKVLIRMKKPETVDQLLNITSRMTYSANGSYIVVCDSTALGVELADRLVKHGARNLVIHMKPNTISGYCHTKFMSWKNWGVSKKVSSEDLQIEKSCVNLLKEGGKLGPIRGIFIVHNFNSGAEEWAPEDVCAKFNKTACVVANLDLMSRNICNELDTFVIVNYSSQKVSDEYVCSVTDKICRSRNEIGLPGLVFRAGPVTELSDIENDNSMKQSQPLAAMFTALETSMKMKHHSAITYNLKKDVTSEFIQKISRIMGVKNIHDLDKDLTLGDLLLNEITIEEIKTAIKNAYKLSFPANHLLNMNLATLKTLGTASQKKNNGLSTFFTFIDKDECSASEPVVSMATSFSCFKEDEWLHPNATYLMLVPGFEGHHHIFTSLCERMKVPTVTCQLAPDMPHESIAQIAAEISEFIRKRVNINTKFYLLGYSFGVNVALELARLFEKEGHVGVVYCLDSSPDALRAQLNAYLGNLTDAQLQNTIIEHMFTLMTGLNSTALKKELGTKENWNDKVELCVNNLKGLVNYSHQFKRLLLNSVYQRIILARQYQPDISLESELILIKGNPHPDMSQLPEDFNLSKYTTKPVKVFNIDADHDSVYLDSKVPNIVNRFLESKLLEEFKNKNLCWTYLADRIKAV